MPKISFPGCLGLFPAISSQFTLKMCASAKNCEKFIKNPFLGVQGRSRSSMLINVKSPPPVLVMISSMYIPICNRFQATRTNSSKISTFRGYRSLTSACAVLLELRESGIKLLKSTFRGPNAENFIRRLSGSISRHFSAIHS